MSTNHTPGRLQVNTQAEYCGARIDAENGRGVFHALQRDPHPTIGQGISQAEAAENARRLAACWNACEGLSTESLERSDTIASMQARIRRLEAELEAVANDGLRLIGDRDHLRAALAQISAMDAEGLRADDLGRAAKIAREAGA